MSDSQVRVLFLCTGNSCRSQMAEGWARFLSKGKVEAFSAGTEPKPLHPLAVRVMQDVGIDISGQQSKAMESYLGQPFDFVITVCDRAKERCPVWPGIKERIHWGFDDPAEATGSEEERLRVFARVRDEIRNRIRLFLAAHKVAS
jgi:arsenate reductase